MALSRPDLKEKERQRILKNSNKEALNYIYRTVWANHLRRLRHEETV